jgi:hypothetical protein
LKTDSFLLIAWLLFKIFSRYLVGQDVGEVDADRRKAGVGVGVYKPRQSAPSAMPSHITKEQRYVHVASFSYVLYHLINSTFVQIF